MPTEESISEEHPDARTGPSGRISFSTLLYIFLQPLREQFRSWHESNARFINWVGLIFPGWLALNGGYWLIRLSVRYWGTHTWRWRWRCGAITLIVLWLLNDVPYLRQLYTVARENKKPFAYQAAIRTKMPPLLFHPIVAIWWLAHSAVIIWVVITISRAKNLPHLPLFADLFMIFCWACAANGFVILAACALTSSERVRQMVWKGRLLSDVALTLLSISFIT